MTKRRIKPEELELWQQVARTAERMHPVRKLQQPLVAPAKKQIVAKEPADIPLFKLGQNAGGKPVGHDVLPHISQRLAAAPLNMDKKAHTRMRRGKMQPEARLDLHGMTLAEAHPALTGFILQSQTMGRRLVLVITGKGKDSHDIGPIPRRRGVLRHQVPQWLRMAPVGQAVLQITEANQKHGGGGALYVYLRRRRG